MRTEAQDSLLAAWDQTLARAEKKPALLNTRGEVLKTFRLIEDRARDVYRSLAEFEAGAVVAIQIGNHFDWASLLLACLRRRIVVLPLEQTISEPERNAALAICRASGLITQKDSTLDVKRINPSRLIDWGKRPPSLLKLTSGTTASPRAIRFRTEQLLADCTQICDTMGITEHDLNFAVAPVSHSYGFSNVITPLIARGVPTVLSRDRMPRAILEDLARTGATIFPGMPIFYQAFCEMDGIPRLDRLRLCISAGAPLPVGVAQEFRDKFKQPIHTFYGSSECGGICYDREATTLEEGFVGKPVDGLELQLLESDAPSSHVRVRSAAVGDGYFPEPDEQKLGNGSFVPDDLLSGSANGYRIVGRVSDVINVAGKKVNPAEVEAELLRFDGVKQAVVFGRESSLRNEEVAACVVAAPGVRETELLEFCRRRLSGWHVPKHIFFVEQIPVNERGKTSRRDLARHFASQKA